MPSTFFGIDTALRGLEAQQTALDVASHNIANASTPGYSRQSVSMQASASWPDVAMSSAGIPGQIGTGVDITSVTRAHDNFVQLQILYQNQQQSGNQKQSDILSQISQIYNEPSKNGFSSLIGNFFTSWQNLANNPSDGPSRAVVAAGGASIAAGFNAASQNLTALQTNANNAVPGLVTQVNTIAQQIAVLNRQVVSVLSIGQQPNDLKDQRDALINTLSQVADIQVTLDSTGSANISLTGGGALVQGISHFDLQIVPNTVNAGLNDVAFTAAPANHLPLTGGTLGGTLVVRDQTIKGQITALDTLANNFLTAVNSYQTAGYDATGTLGAAFFTGNTAGAITENPLMATNPNSIAAATTVKTPAAVGPPAIPAVPNPEDGSNALNISKLQENVFGTQTQTIQSQFASIIGALGVNAQQTATNVQTGTLVLQNLNSQQLSVSGVSLNEEAANLVQYQNAYQASARVISIMNTTISDMIRQLGG